MTSQKQFLIIISFFILLTTVIFREYIFFHKVVFPGNLLVTFYEPWAAYPKEGYPHGLPAKPIGFDTLRSFYPTRALVTQAIQKRQMPLWNLYSFSGNVLFAAYQSAVFHPATILFLFLAQVDAWSITIILAPILTAIFSYLFLKSLGLGVKASVFGALTYAFSGIMIVWWEEMFMAVYSMLFLPLVLYAIERRWWILMAVSLSLSIFSGWFQATIYVYGFSFIWMLFHFWPYKKHFRSLVTMMGGYVLSLGLAAIHLLPSFEAYQLSSRPLEDTRQMLAEFFVPVGHAVTALAPDFFGNPATHNYFGSSFYHENVLWLGVPALLFILYALFTWKAQPSKCRFLMISGIAILSLGFNLPTSWAILYRLHLPFLSQMTPSRIFFLSSFCLSMVAGYGINHFMSKASMKSMSRTLFVLGISFAGAWVWAFNFKYIHLRDFHAAVPIRNLILPTIFFVLTSGAVLSIKWKKRFTRVGYFAIIVISIAGTLLFTQKYLYFSDRKFVYPSTPIIQELQKFSGINRFWSVGEGHIMRNFANILGLYSPEGYESFNSRRYGELIFASHHKGKLPESLQRADALLYQVKDMNELDDDPIRKKMLSLLGVKYIAALYKNIFTTLSDFTLVWTDNIYDLYEYKKVLPRFFLANNFIVETDKQKILDKIYSTNFPLDKTVILEEVPVNFFPGTNENSQAELVSYIPNQIKFSTNSTGDKILFLSDTYFPGWKAYVGDTSTKIYRADYAFRAVVIPSGAHRITFVYKPDSFWWGMGISGISLLVLLLAPALKISSVTPNSKGRVAFFRQKRLS